ncbi:hypothetical protein Micbo1qcDRAFT_236547 [Microdochium bolleyi]|uniref:Uncharacterized protein n=1 Tax=Microdochium bolleyi TaxID=196109 RepID=A0A136IQT7_9PEZI|nr:hypothetical protein Micbo1qcDRAFT_236547 [Microdochium bolleyi]
MPFRAPDTNLGGRPQVQIQHITSPAGTAQRFVYKVAMPQLLNSDDEPLPCYEPAEETTAISAHLSSQVYTVFQQIVSYRPPPDNAAAPVGHELSICIKPDTFQKEPYCLHRKYNSRRLQLYHPELLPDLPSVRSLTVSSLPDYHGTWERETYSVRLLSPLWPMQCLVHLPRAEELRLPWMWERPMPGCMPSRVVREHYTRPWEGPLRDARHDFGAAMAEQDKYLCGRIPASLTHAALHFWTPRQSAKEDQAIPRPNLIHPAEGDRDPVSTGLRILARQLRFLDLRALVTKDLFPATEAYEEHHQWRHMRRMRIEFHPLRPDGRWYFIGPHDEDPHDSEEGGFRITEEHYPPESDTEEDEDLDMEFDNDPKGGSESDNLPDMFRIEPFSMPLRETDPNFEDEALDQTKMVVAAEPSGVLKYGVYDISLPLLLSSEEHPLPCHEPAEERAAVSAHVSARIHAYYKQIAAYYAGLVNPPADVWLTFFVQPQGFEHNPECEHRNNHARRLQLHEDGRWYFIGPSGEDPHDSQGGYDISEKHYPREFDTAEDEDLDVEYGNDPDGGSEYDALPDMFRIKPHREKIEPLLVAFAKALTGMPSLEDAEMFAYLTWHPADQRKEEYISPNNLRTHTHRWGVKFVAGRGEKASDEAGPVVQWQVGDWRPSQDVLGLFGSLGRQEWLDLKFEKDRNPPPGNHTVLD